MNRGSLHVSGVYTSPFLHTDERKMALRDRKVSGAFEKQAPGRSLSQFLKHEATRGISASPWMRLESITGLPPALCSPVPIYTSGWREALRELIVLPKNTTQCLRPGFEPGPKDPETSSLALRPPLRSLYSFVMRF